MKLKKQLKIARRENTRLLTELAFSSKARDADLTHLRKIVLQLRDKRVALNEREKELAAALQTLAALSKRIDFED